MAHKHRIAFAEPLDREIARLAMEDESFRDQLLANPKKTVEEWIRKPLPPNAKVNVIQADPNTLYLIIPSASAVTSFAGVAKSEAGSAANGCCRNMTLSSCCTTYSTFSN